MGFFASGQSPSFIHLTEKDGLPDIEFYDILQDRKGFVWLAADKGLFRYDGKEFKLFKHPQQRGLSIFNLVEDHQGRVWCKNILGQIFYIQNNKIQLFMDLKGVVSNYLFNINVLDNQLLVVDNNRTLTIDIETKEICPYDVTTMYIPGSSITFKEQVFRLNEGQLIIYSTKGVTKKPVDFPNVDFLKVKYTLFQFKSHLYVFLNYNGRNQIFRFNDDFNSITQIALPQKLIERTITNFEEVDGKLWFASSKGALQVTIENSKIIITNQYLKNKNVTKYMLDSDGNSWFTTLNDGVYVLPNFYIQEYELPPDLQYISSMDKVSENELVFGTYNGRLGWYDIEKQRLELYPQDFSEDIKLNYFKNIQQVALSLSKSRKGYLISKQGAISSPSLIGIKDFSQINETSFLAATFRDALIFQIEKNNTITTKELPHKNRSYACYFDAFQKQYFVSYADNLIQYDLNFKEQVILHQKQPILALDIAKTNNGIIWVSTFSDGIIGIKNGEVKKTYTVANGLSSNTTTKIESDGAYLWVVTDTSIHKINTQTDTIQTLTKQDGIPSFKVSDILFLKNKAVLSSNIGIFEIDKQRAFSQKPSPKLYFKNIKIVNEVAEILPKYDLAYDENTLRIDFHVNSFKTNENYLFEYRLVGGNETWTTLDLGLDFIEFIRLPSGKYRFEVRAKNYFTKALSPTKTIAFTIAKPLWKRWYFMLFCFFVSLFGAYLYFRSIERKKERKRNFELSQLQIENRLNALKLENLRSQMNPHFIFNALNSIQEYILLNKKNLASDYLGKFSDLVRSYLQHSTQEKVSLEEEIECLTTYLELEKMRFEEKFTYKIIQSEEFYAETVYIPTMLVQPYVENAIKHGLLHKKNNCFLSVSFSFDKNYKNIICIVEDNGVGRAKAKTFQLRRNKRHQSFATQANQNRLELLNKGKTGKIGVKTEDLIAKDGSPLGTRVTITSPYFT